MQAYLALIILLLAPQIGRASDNSCIVNLKHHWVADAPDLPMAVLAKFPAATTAVKSNIQFSHQTMSGDFADIKVQQISYVLKSGNTTLYIQNLVMSLETFATDGLFSTETKIQLMTADGTPLVYYDTNYVYGGNCQANETMGKRLEFTKTDAGVSVSETQTQKGQPASTNTYVSTTANVLAWSTLTYANSYSDMILQKSRGFKSANDDEGQIWRLRYSPAAEIKRRDSFSGSLRTLSGTVLSAQGPKNKSLLVSTFGLSGSPYFYSESQADGAFVMAVESMPQATWLNEIPNDHDNGFYIKMVGVTADDFKGPQFNYRIDLKNKTTLYENWRQYFTSAAGDGSGYSISTKMVNTYPHALPANAPTAPEDGVYLKGTHYIQLDAVKTIADGLRPSIVGKDRLEASLVIMAEMQKLLAYDKTNYQMGDVEMLTTEEILRTHAGVCQHYAALFTAIARSLGIPSRIIFGMDLNATGAVGHAWIEVKIDETTWWPLDPQNYLSNTLPNLAFFPETINFAYEHLDSDPVPVQTLMDNLNWVDIQYRRAKITKLPVK